jgi:hypothetical protein
VSVSQRGFHKEKNSWPRVELLRCRPSCRDSLNSVSPVAASFQLVRVLCLPRGGKFSTCPIRPQAQTRKSGRERFLAILLRVAPQAPGGSRWGDAWRSSSARLIQCPDGDGSRHPARFREGLRERGPGLPDCTWMRAEEAVAQVSPKRERGNPRDVAKRLRKTNEKAVAVAASER